MRCLLCQSFPVLDWWSILHVCILLKGRIVTRGRSNPHNHNSSFHGLEKRCFSLRTTKWNLHQLQIIKENTPSPKVETSSFPETPTVNCFIISSHANWFCKEESHPRLHHRFLRCFRVLAHYAHSSLSVEGNERYGLRARTSVQRLCVIASAKSFSLFSFMDRSVVYGNG